MKSHIGSDRIWPSLRPELKSLVLTKQPLRHLKCTEKTDGLLIVSKNHMESVL